MIDWFLALGTGEKIAVFGIIVAILVPFIKRTTASVNKQKIKGNHNIQIGSNSRVSTSDYPNKENGGKNQ